MSEGNGMFSQVFFAIYHVVEELSFDKYGLVREAKKKELTGITSSRKTCENKIKEYENKFEIKDNVIVADYWYYIPITIKEKEAPILRNAEKNEEEFEKMTSMMNDIFGGDLFGVGKSESVSDTSKKTEKSPENVKKKGVFRR